MTIKNVLSIAGTDPTGGAGIHADLKAFSARGTYGMAAITAVVAQNTRGVRSFMPLDPSFVGEQIDAVFDDVRVDAVKIGMVANAAIAEVIAERLQYHEAETVVLDPVMVAKSGDRLLDDDAVAAIRDTLVPLATIITPNLPEAAVLLDTTDVTRLGQMEDQGHRAAWPWLSVGATQRRASHERDGQCRLPRRPRRDLHLHLSQDRNPQRPRHRLHLVLGDHRTAT